MRLGDVADGRDNNFNLIRILAAGAVVVSHAFPIALGTGAVEPLETATGRSLGWIAVAVFFAISGFLITRSYERTRQVSRWLSARAMRLFPGLAVVLVLTAALYGPAFTTLPLPGYFADGAVYSYVPRNLSLAFLQAGLPGVFADNPLPVAINGSLWTLMHEVTCYAGVLALGLCGGLASRRCFTAFLAAYLIVFALANVPAVEAGLHPRALALRDLSYPFVLGMALFHWRAAVPLSWLVAAALGGAAMLARATPLFEPVFIGAIAYTTFVFAYRVGGAVRAYNRVGDYSYGLYIYAFPTQQAVAAIAGPHSPLANIAWSLPIALSLALVSWHWIEHPALENRHRLANWLARGEKLILPLASRSEPR